MTILEGLEKLAGTTTKMIEFLERVARQLPDLADEANEKIALLRSAAAMENLVSLAGVLPGEIADVAKGQIRPKDHPSDAI